MKISIRLLREADDRTTFHSGDIELDRFFEKYAGQNQFRHHIGSTYIATIEETSDILGFATVAPGHIDDVPLALRSKLPRYPLPVLRLARLAVSEKAQRRGIGAALMRFVFDLALSLSVDYGCIGILVDAKPVAESFYAQYGFYPVQIIQGQSGTRPRAIPMFLPIGTIRLATKKPGI